MIYFQFITIRLLEVTDFKVNNVERTQLWVSARVWVVQIGDAAQNSFFLVG